MTEEDGKMTYFFGSDLVQLTVGGTHIRLSPINMEMDNLTEILTANWMPTIKSPFGD